MIKLLFSVLMLACAGMCVMSVITEEEVCVR